MQGLGAVLGESGGGKRTKAALAAKARRDERTGGVPYGCRLADDGARLVDDGDEQAVIARIVDMADRGNSHRAVAATLNVEGVPARGAAWHAATVGRGLRRHREPAAA